VLALIKITFNIIFWNWLRWFGLCHLWISCTVTAD